MGRSIDPMSEKTKTGSGPAAAPRLIVPMSLQPAIPRRVALQQSSPPLHRLGVTLNEKAKFEKQKPWNGKRASSKLSQLRGSVHTLGCAGFASVTWSAARGLEDRTVYKGAQPGVAVLPELL